MKLLIEECGVYVVHAPRGYESHERHIRNHFSKHNLSFSFVSEDDLNRAHGGIELDQFFTPGLIECSSKGALFCTLSHIAAYYKLIDSGQKYALIFEDDAFLVHDFLGKLEKMHDEIASEKSGFVISLENTNLKFPSFFQTRRGKKLYIAESGRMAGGYLIDAEGAKSCIRYLEERKCSNIIDIWHNQLSDEGFLTIYWLQPTLVEQGSHNGKSFSGISSRPATLQRRVIWIVTKLFKMSFRRLFKQRRILDV